MHRSLITAALSLLALTAVTGQPCYNHDALSTERLDRGVIAIRQADGPVFVSWRTLRSDKTGEPFDVYRDGVKLNRVPLTEGGTWLIDSVPPAGDALYEVRGGESNGSFLLRADQPAAYIPIAIDKPAGGVCPTLQDYGWTDRRGRRWRDDGHYDYTANDCSVADVDGDGQYEIILKWEPTNAHDNSHDGYTGPTLFDCYKVDWANPSSIGNSRLLWRIDMGRNIRSGAHYVPFIVYDLDGDGRAELMVKTADGTRDGLGRVIGDSTADYRNDRGRILDGPEYITVFDGLTGAALDTKPYIPQRGNTADWGDTRGNRSERYLAAVGYLGEGVKGSERGVKGSEKTNPSALFCRGYYTRTVIAAWDWDGKELQQHWVFDTDEPQWHDYAGQGNHNLRVADVDGDGLDELIYGAMTVDHDGCGLYTTRMGHGDAIHLVPDPQTGRLYVWDCHENRRDGSELHDARTGDIILQIKSRIDVGRCLAADIDPTNPGLEMWSIDSHGIQPTQQSQQGLSINFAIWWDGDLLRELLDHERVSKYDWTSRTVVELQRFDGLFNNGTKSNPCLAADILGDWREEVLVRNRESTELRLYSTTIPTPYRIDCLMHDIPYRHSVATQNVGYNQPSEPGFYLGPDRTDYLK